MSKKAVSPRKYRTGALRVFLAFAVLFPIFAVAESGVQERSIALGFIAYSKYKGFNEYKKKGELATLKEAGADPVMIALDSDIFLPENEREIKKYKRLWIPGYAQAFPEKIYAGMKKYVEDGGLLITRDSLIITDITAIP